MVFFGKIQYLTQPLRTVFDQNAVPIPCFFLFDAANDQLIELPLFLSNFIPPKNACLPDD